MDKLTRDERIDKIAGILAKPLAVVFAFVATHTLTPLEQRRLVIRLKAFVYKQKSDRARREYEKQHDALLHEFLNTPRDSPGRPEVESRIHDMALMGDPYWTYVSAWLKSGKHPDEFAKEMGL